MAYIGREPLGGEVILLNSIESQFNGVLTTFNLTRTVSGVTSAFYPVGSEQLLVSLGGVIQRPDTTGDTGFRISFNTIIFAVAPTAGTSCFIVAYGNVTDIGAPANNTVSTDKLVNGAVTPAKLSTGGPWWLSNGNVGIGTTNPINNLHVFASSVSGFSQLSTHDRLIIENGISSQGATLQLVSNATNGVSEIGFSDSARNRGLISYQHSTDSFRFHTSATEVACILSTGNFGIGTTNPLTSLDIRSSSTEALYLRRSDNANAYGFLGISGSNFRIGSFISGSGWGNIILNDGGGNVGIGTITPAEKFHIHAQGTDLAVIRLSGTATLQTPYNIRQGITGVSNAGFSIYDVTAAATRFAIDSAGNIGIGTSPTTKLDVLGTTEFISDSSAPASTTTPNCYIASGNSADRVALEVTQGRFNKDAVLIKTNQRLAARLLNITEDTTTRFLVNGVDTPTDPGNTVFYTGSYFDASNYMVLQNNTDSYGRIGLVIRGKTFNGVNTPTGNDGWSLPSARSGIRFEAHLFGDTGFDSKFAIQHLLAGGTNNSIGDLGILAKGFSTTTPAMVLNASGNVGIGTTNAVTKLEAFLTVQGQNAERYTPVDVLSIGADNPGSTVYGGFGQGLTFKGRTYNVSTYRVLGRILHRIWDDSVNTTLGSSLEFQTANNGSVAADPTTKLIINYTGNVGIGTMNPTQKLHVEGGICQSGQHIIRNANQYYEVYPILHMHSDNGNPPTTLLTINGWSSIYSTAFIEIEVWASHAISGLASYARGAALAHYNGTRSLSALTAITSFGSFGVGTIAWSGASTAGSTGFSLTYTGPGSNYTRSYIKITVNAHDGADISFSTSY